MFANSKQHLCNYGSYPTSVEFRWAQFPNQPNVVRQKVPLSPDPLVLKKLPWQILWCWTLTPKWVQICHQSPPCLCCKAVNITVHTVLITLYCSYNTVHTIQSTIFSAHFSVHTVLYTMYSPHCTFYTVLSTLYSQNCTVYTLKLIFFSPHCTVQIV